ncbi:MAG: NosD domain-containing protein [Nibricoccus sp.]
MKISALIFVLVASTSFAANPGDELRGRLAAAAEGDTLVVEAGDYAGPFVIEKTLHLIGRPGAILRGNGETHIVAVRAPRVEIAGFVVRHSGRDLGKDHAAIHITGAEAYIHDNKVMDCLHGIYVRKVDRVRIENNIVLGDGAMASSVADPVASGLKPGESELCDVETVQDRRGNGIHLWNSKGHRIIGNRISGTRDGIYFSFTDETLVRENTIHGVRYGLHYMYSDDNTFERNDFTENAAGSALMYSKGIVLRENHFHANRSHRAYGLLFQSVDDTRVEGNVIEGNTLGFYLENSNHVTVVGNRISGNHVGLRVSDSTSDGVFSENSFHGNIHPVETNGKNIANAWAQSGRGNQWEGALPIDMNRDGIADVAHREPDLFGVWRREFPAVGLLSASPGERLLRFIHSRLALPQMPGVTDPKPLLTQNRKSSP